MLEELVELLAVEVALGGCFLREFDDLVELARLEEELGREEALYTGDVGERAPLLFDQLFLGGFHDLSAIDAVGGEDAIGQFVGCNNKLVVLEVGAYCWVVDEAFHTSGLKNLPVPDAGEFQDLW